jgi:hypothetical protein
MQWIGAKQKPPSMAKPEGGTPNQVVMIEQKIFIQKKLQIQRCVLQ